MQSQHKLPEVNGVTLISTKCPEHILHELVGMPTWKQLDIHGLQLLLCHLPTGTVLHKAAVPVLNKSKSHLFLLHS